MRMTFSLLLIAALASAALADGPSQATGEEDLLALADELFAAGRLAVENGLDDNTERALHLKIRRVLYDESSLNTLQKILGENEDPEVMLYVATRLFKPLVYARKEVALAGTSMLRETYGRYAGYKHLPEYTPEELAAMVEPMRDGDESDETFERRRQRRAERREEKMRKDRLVQFYNQNLRLLERQTVTLMLRADKSGYDNDLISWMLDSEKDRLLRFAWVLEAMRTAARDMDPDRAAGLYRKLKKYLTRESMKVQTYTDPSSITLKATENSTYATEQAAPGDHLLRTINHLATTAELPALLPPTQRRTTDD